MAASFLKSFFQKRFDAWLKRRVPSSFHHTLSRRNIFIMPTKFGFAYLLFVFLLFLLATNYQNNIIMLMSYLLASLFISIMIHSFYNFSGLGFKSTATHSGFAEQAISIPISIITDKPCFDLTLSFVKTPQYKVSLEHCSQGDTKVILPYVSKERGVITTGRVKISSEYSFGLFISWAVLDFSHQLTIYPHPKKINENQYRLTGQENQNSCATSYESHTPGLDDFSELKDYVLGESKSRTAWKQFARGQGRYTKHYQNQQSTLNWLKLSDMPSVNIETQLSFLCYLVLEYCRGELQFGLDLTSKESGVEISPDQKIEPDLGFVHQKNCLTALATYSKQTKS